MSRKRLTAWVLLLAVAMTARITVAAPRATVSQLRAAVCCVEHCADVPRSPATGRRCCFVASGADDPASMVSTSTLDRPAPTAVVPALPAAPSGTGARTVQPLETRRTGPPVLPITQKLRC